MFDDEKTPTDELPTIESFLKAIGADAEWKAVGLRLLTAIAHQKELENRKTELWLRSEEK